MTQREVQQNIRWFALGFTTCMVLYALVSAARADTSLPPFSVELTAQEGSLIMGLLDQAIKQNGYTAAKQAVPVMDKMIAASQKAQAMAAEAAKKAEFEQMKADEEKNHVP